MYDSRPFPDLDSPHSSIDCCAPKFGVVAARAFENTRSTSDKESIVQALQAASSAREIDGDTLEAYRLALEAERTATAHGLRREAGRAQLQLGQCLAAAGQLDRATERMRAGLKVFQTLGDVELEIIALQALARLHMEHGHYQSMLVYQEEAHHLLGRGRFTQQWRDTHVQLAEGYAKYAAALMAHGLHFEARGLSRRALDMLAPYHNPDVRALACSAQFRLLDTTAQLQLLQGNDRLAVHCAEALLREGRKRGVTWLVATACERFADVRLAQGRAAQAIGWLERASAHWATTERHRESVRMRDRLSDAYSAFDRHAQALVHHKEARRIEARGRSAQAALRAAMMAVDRSANPCDDELKTASHDYRVATLGRMAASIAHEVTQPLTAIRLLAESAIADPVQARESLSSIVQRIEQLGIYVAHIKRFSRSEPVQMRAVPLSCIVDEALAIVEPKRKYSGVSLHVDRAAVSDSSVFTDLSCVTGVLVNLLSNAFDAVTGSRQAKVVLSAQVHGDHAVLSVRDHGEGLSAQTLAHLFEPFHSTKSAGKGSGLGLSLSSELARHLGARLKGVNHPQGGALFTLDLPLASVKKLHRPAMQGVLATDYALGMADAGLRTKPAFAPRSSSAYA